jgi:hypothetical protein
MYGDAGLRLVGRIVLGQGARVQPERQPDRVHGPDGMRMERDHRLGVHGVGLLQLVQRHVQLDILHRDARLHLERRPLHRFRPFLLLEQHLGHLHGPDGLYLGRDRVRGLHGHALWHLHFEVRGHRLRGRGLHLDHHAGCVQGHAHYLHQPQPNLVLGGARLRLDHHHGGDLHGGIVLHLRRQLQRVDLHRPRVHLDGHNTGLMLRHIRAVPGTPGLRFVHGPVGLHLVGHRLQRNTHRMPGGNDQRNMSF